MEKVNSVLLRFNFNLLIILSTKERFENSENDNRRLLISYK